MDKLSVPILNNVRKLWNEISSVWPWSRFQLLPCPLDELKSHGYELVKFVKRSSTFNTLLMTTVTLDDSRQVVIRQVAKEVRSSKPPMTGNQHLCGPIALSYLSAGDNWIFVSGRLNHGDVHSHIRKLNLPPGHQRELVMLKLVNLILTSMGRCHDLGLHHCHFDWHAVYLDDTMRPLWIESANHKCCRKPASGDAVSTGCVDVVNRMIKSRGRTTPEVVDFGREAFCGQLDAVESWAFGASLLEVLLGRRITETGFQTGNATSPIATSDRKSTIRSNVEALGRILGETDLSAECQLFLVNLLRFEPEDRMRLSEAAVHPWVVFGGEFAGVCTPDFRFDGGRTFSRCRPSPGRPGGERRRGSALCGKTSKRLCVSDEQDLSPQPINDIHQRLKKRLASDRSTGRTQSRGRLDRKKVCAPRWNPY